MKFFRCVPVVCLFFLLTFTIITVPCHAASSDVRIPVQASATAQVHMCVDDNLIATYVGGSSPPAITVYNPDMTLYRSIPLTNDTMDIESLEISDGRVYYAEYDTSELWTSRTKTVYEYDLATGDTRIIYSTGFYNNIEPRVTDIATDGDHVVLRENCGGDDLILHTLSTGTNNRIFRSGDMIQGLAIDGDRIVWGCDRTDGESGREIHVYTITTGEDDVILESRTDKTFGTADISGDTVVWMKALYAPSWNDGSYTGMRGSEIMLTDLVTGMTTSLEKMEGYSKPFISGETVVFVNEPEVDYDNPNAGTIRVYDIGAATFSDIASEVAGVTDFEGELVLWRRYSPRSDWLTAISGTIPTAVTAENTQSATEIPDSVAQNNSPQKNPIGLVALASVLIAGIVGFAILKKRK